MNIDPYILTFSALTVIATIWMGFRSARTSKTTSDFFVAGRSVSVGWNASAISGEYLSAASFMGVAGMVMSSGYDALWYPVCYACGYLFLLLFIAGPLRRFGAYTIPDFAEGRFDSPVFRKIAVVFVLFIGFFYTMPQMKGAGTTLAYIFPGLPYWAGVVLVGAVITLNVALGGMKGITLVQAFQYWAKMFAISVPIFVLMAVYGHYGNHLQANLKTAETSSIISEGDVSTSLETASEIGRKELPQKAPVDATWLNPFGPLTTKAAKNAAAAIGKKELAREGAKEAKENASAASPFANFVPSRETIPLRPGLLPDQRMTVNLDSLTTMQALGIYAELTGRQLLPHTNSLAERADDLLGGKLSQLKIISRPPAPDSGVREHGDGAFTAAEVKTTIEAQLRTNGLTLQAVGKTGFELKKAGANTIYWGSGASPSINGASANLSDGTAEVSGTVAGLLHGTAGPRDGTAEVSDEPAGVSGGTAGLNGGTAGFSRGAARLSDGATEASDGTASLVQVPFSSAAAPLSQAVRSMSPAGSSLNAAAPSPNPAGPSGNQGAAPLERGVDSAVQMTPAAAEKAWLDKHEKPLALLYTYSLIIALVCGTAGLPHILVRFYTNPDGTAAKRTTMWVMILIGVFYLFPPIFGVMGRNLLPSLYAGTGAKGTDKVVLELPRILNEGDVPRRGEGSEGKTPSPTSVPSQASRPSRDTSSSGIPWGSILSGITCAGAFAAFMSTFSGLLVSMTGALAHDVYGRILRPKATPEQRLRMFKISAVLIGSVAILLGSFVEPLQINFMVGQAFAIAAASYFPLLFMSVWWRGMTMKGAAAGMLAGGICALAAVTITNFSDLKWINLADFWAANPLLRILCEQPAIWTVPLAIGLMIVVSKLTKREVPSDSRMKMLVLHAPEQLGLKQEYIQEHQHGH